MKFINRNIEELEPYYVPDMEEGEIKMDAQENPYDLDPDIKGKIEEGLRALSLNRYPDPGYPALKKLLAEYSGTDPDNILVGNGSDELILMILLASGGPGKTVTCPAPTFSMYGILSKLTNTAYAEVPLGEGFSLQPRKILATKPDIVFIAYPNNPTGNCFSRKDIEKILKESKGLVVVDEAYYEFSGKTFADCVKDYENLMILRTFSKAFSLAGIRAGYIICSKSLIKQLRKVQLPYNMSVINQSVLEMILKNRGEVLKTVGRIIESRGRLMAELDKISGVSPYPSDANFILIKIDNIDRTMERLEKRKIKVRRFVSENLRDYLRVTVGTENENRSFIEVMTESVQEGK
ncbi:MAG: histidinol-phosphate transaminase [Elusimicrobia bacterium]|nr:histidinol-phosphate transaminase [Elusimicrobiota bacterium]